MARLFCTIQHLGMKFKGFQRGGLGRNSRDQGVGEWIQRSLNYICPWLFLHRMTLNATKPLVFKIIIWIFHDLNYFFWMIQDHIYHFINSWCESEKLWQITILKSWFFELSMSFIQMDVTLEPIEPQSSACAQFEHF